MIVALLVDRYHGTAALNSVSLAVNSSVPSVSSPTTMLSPAQFTKAAQAFESYWRNNWSEYGYWEWQVVTSPLSNHQGCGYLLYERVVKSIAHACVAADELPNEADDVPDEALASRGTGVALHVYQYHVVYHQSYRTPALFFRAQDAGGVPLTLQQIQADLPESYKQFCNIQSARPFFIVPEEHPLLSLPFLMLHPCQTAHLMSLMLAPARADDHDAPDNTALPPSKHAWPHSTTPHHTTCAHHLAPPAPCSQPHGQHDKATILDDEIPAPLDDAPDNTHELPCLDADLAPSGGGTECQRASLIPASRSHEDTPSRNAPSAFEEASGKLSRSKKAADAVGLMVNGVAHDVVGGVGAAAGVVDEYLLRYLRAWYTLMAPAVGLPVPVQPTSVT